MTRRSARVAGGGRWVGGRGVFDVRHDDSLTFDVSVGGNHLELRIEFFPICARNLGWCKAPPVNTRELMVKGFVCRKCTFTCRLS